MKNIKRIVLATLFALSALSSSAAMAEDAQSSSSSGVKCFTVVVRSKVSKQEVTTYYIHKSTKGEAEKEARQKMEAQDPDLAPHVTYSVSVEET